MGPSAVFLFFAVENSQNIILWLDNKICNASSYFWCILKNNTVKLTQKAEQVCKKSSGIDLPVPDLYW